MLYVPLSASALRWARSEHADGWDLRPGALRYVLDALSAAIVPVSLVTLGAQLTTRVRSPAGLPTK